VASNLNLELGSSPKVKNDKIEPIFKKSAQHKRWNKERIIRSIEETGRKKGLPNNSMA
jgi:hypothetical protein